MPSGMPRENVTRRAFDTAMKPLCSPASRTTSATCSRARGGRSAPAMRICPLRIRIVVRLNGDGSRPIPTSSHQAWRRLTGRLARAMGKECDCPQAGAEVSFIGNIDCVRPGTPIDTSTEGTRARWDRYAKFAEKTFNVSIPAIPYEELEKLDDAGQVQFVLNAVRDAGVQIPGGIIEHQRTSYLDNRALDVVDIKPYDGRMVLYMADRYQDDAITFEPAYATRAADGGWGDYVPDLEIVHIGGEHIQAIDEPFIAKIGAHMSQAIDQIQNDWKASQ